MTTKATPLRVTVTLLLSLLYSKSRLSIFVRSTVLLVALQARYYVLVVYYEY